MTQTNPVVENNISYDFENYDVLVPVYNNQWEIAQKFTGNKKVEDFDVVTINKDNIKLIFLVNHDTRKIAILTKADFYYFGISRQDIINSGAEFNDDEYDDDEDKGLACKSPNKLDIDFSVEFAVSFRKPRFTNSNYYSHDKFESYPIRNYNNQEPYRYLTIKLIRNGKEISVDVPFEKPETGKAKAVAESNVIIVEAEFFGEKFAYRHALIDGGFYRTFNNCISLMKVNDFDEKSIGIIFNVLSGLAIRNSDGVAKLEKKYAKALNELRNKSPRAYDIYVLLHSAKKSEGASANTLLGAFLEECNGDVDKMSSALIDVFNKKNINAIDCYSYSYNEVSHYGETVRKLCTNLPGAKEKETERRAKTEWNIRTGILNQAEGLGINKTNYPKLTAMVEDKSIPLSIFHEPGKPDDLINIELDLWEKSLNRKGWAEVIGKIAQDASKRKQYEKRITQYFAFLFKIETYLKKHTGKKWTAMPKFVESQWELEMGEADENGTTKKRSAMTPIVDNEKCIVTVPYVSMAIYGRQTTYCYSLNYYVFEENNIDAESDTPILSDLSYKLNGRDDYGLMYFTLTGTARNTGYPTFLIIFERLTSKKETRVHFHRVHPCRSKNGKTTPACKLIEECYRYMAGNVRAEEIYRQQGDLIFIKADEQKELESAKDVNEFESHRFVKENGMPMKLVENKAKSIKNRLGFIYSDVGFSVQHPEHEHLEKMPPGWYEIRRAKSYENNPVAVWSLNID